MTQLGRRGLPTASQLVSRLLENPNLLAAVRELPGSVLGRLIESVGLEDAGEIVALASDEQLEAVFDEDLWKTGDGGWEERFDPARFALWLHVFSEAGEAALIERLNSLPLDFLTLAVQRLILVVDIDALGADMSEGGEELDALEKALDSCLCEEWEEFRLIARDPNAWDELTSALFALDREHHGRLRQILERCQALSSEWIAENGGLYEVLSSDEMLEGDVRAERDDRRAKKGYVSPADARAFLELARRGGAANERDAITRAYFRELEREPPKAGPKPRRPKTQVSALMKLLAEANVIDGPSRKIAPKRPGKPKKEKAETAAVAKASLAVVDLAAAELTPELYAERMEELGYLANVLVAASQSEKRHLRPVEALETALSVASAGLERALAETAPPPSSSAERSAAIAAILRERSMDQLFRLGFHALGDAGAAGALSTTHIPLLARGRP
jgi:hypothetical protein